MEQELNRQISSVQNEVNFLKSALNPIFLFLQEIQEIKKKHRISQNNSISNTAVLSMDIKEEILKDVTALQIATEEKLSDIRLEIKHFHEENTETSNKLRDDICGVSLNSKDLFSSLNNLKNQTGENSIYIKEILKDMETKATLHNIDEIRQIIKGLTPISNYETLKSRVSECASTYQHNELVKKLEKLKLKVKNSVKTEEMDSKLREFTMSLSKSFSLCYVTSGIYEAHQNRIEKMFNDSNEHFTSLKEYVNKLDSANNEKFRLIKKTMESRPWKNELNAIYEELNRKIPRAELDEYTKDTREAVKDFSKDMKRFKCQVEIFEKVVERFDEVLLDKAEKDETRKINIAICGLASSDTVEGIKKSISAYMRDNEVRFQTQCAIADKMKANFDYLLERFETFKKDNFDVSNFSSTVMEFRQTIDRKADKQDIYEIYDNMCKRCDFIEAYENLKTLKKQVEQGSGLMFALCRSLLETGESTTKIKRQRYELLKNFNNLMNWITGENSTCTSNLNSSRNPEPENEDQGESRFPSRHSVYFRRRSAAATTRDVKRFHIDFPKLS